MLSFMTSSYNVAAARNKKGWPIVAKHIPSHASFYFSICEGY